MMRSRPCRYKTMIGIVGLICMVSISNTVSLPAQTLQAPVSAKSNIGPRDPVEIEAFVDGVVSAQREAHHIAGVVVSIVADGEILFSKGYGYADIDRKKRVDPEKALFRVGSITKLFIWTAAMQLVAQGRLDLDEDINSYLTAFKIPDTYADPITMGHLMTHTPGFKDVVIGIFSRDSQRMGPLGDFLAENLPARMRPPGRLGAYSNYGAALAGYIVEEISGIPWETYVETHILQPLDMQHTTVRQPVPSDLSADMALGYIYTDGEYRSKAFEFVLLGPAGGMTGTATDMAHFMIAHLQNGRYDAARILPEDIAIEMHRRRFAHDDRLNGVAHGFMDYIRNGQRIIGHNGDTFFFHTGLSLFPEHNLGVFVSYNSDTGTGARHHFLTAFLDHYFPIDQTTIQKKPISPQRMRQVEGIYTSIRVSSSTIGKLADLISAVQVSSEGNDGLKTTQSDIHTRRWVEGDPWVFHEVNGRDTMIFSPDEEGEVTHLFFSSVPVSAFVKRGLTGTPSFHYVILSFTTLLFLYTVVSWPIRAHRKRGRGLPTGNMARVARITSWSLGVLVIGFLICFILGMANPTEIVFGFPALLHLMLWFALFITALAIISTCFTVLVWKHSYWCLSARFYFTLTSIAGLILVWWLNFWNMLAI